MRWLICTRNLLMVKRGVCLACLFWVKTTTMDCCLHQHAPLVLMRTSISWCQKRSVPTNKLMSALTGLASILFFYQRCIIVDTIIRNPTKFFPKCNHSVPQPTTPMSYNSHDPYDPWWKHKANKLLKDVWTSQPCQNWEMISLITWKYSTVTPSINHAKKILVVLWTERATGRLTRNISIKYHYSRTWWIPLKLCFLIFPPTWYGCCANQKKVMGFRDGTKTFTWVDKSPRLLLSMLEVKLLTMKRPQHH